MFGEMNMKMKEILKAQSRYWNDRIAREKVYREWKERQKAKFEGKHIVEMLHEPKGVERNV